MKIKSLWLPFCGFALCASPAAAGDHPILIDTSPPGAECVLTDEGRLIGRIGPTPAKAVVPDGIPRLVVECRLQGLRGRTHTDAAAFGFHIPSLQRAAREYGFFFSMVSMLDDLGEVQSREATPGIPGSPAEPEIKEGLIGVSGENLDERVAAVDPAEYNEWLKASATDSATVHDYILSRKDTTFAGAISDGGKQRYTRVIAAQAAVPAVDAVPGAPASIVNLGSELGYFAVTFARGVSVPVGLGLLTDLIASQGRHPHYTRIVLHRAGRDNANFRNRWLGRQHRPDFWE